mgnify:FL=1
MAILFISSLTPDREEYWTSAFSRSGFNVIQGVGLSMADLVGNDQIEYISMPSYQSYPNAPLWIKGKKDTLENGVKVTILSTLNLKVIKSIHWSLQYVRIIQNWAKKHQGEECKVLIYNTYHPSIDHIYKACKKAGVKLYCMLYDLGVPPKRLRLSKLTMIGYERAEKIAEKYIPLLDGRIVINERIVSHYAPDKDFLLVDGGITDQLVSKLFPLKVSKSKTCTFVLAGMLWDQNGTRLVLEALKIRPNLNVKIKICGKGIDVPLIEEAAKEDSRIEYLGMLTQDQLFKVYEEADVLLNLRIEEEGDFHFPGKLLECLTMGKLVVSTPIAHAERDYGKYMKVLHDVTSEGLSNLMQEITETPKYELYELGKRARVFMLKNRTWKKRTEDIIAYMNIK